MSNGHIFKNMGILWKLVIWGESLVLFEPQFPHLCSERIESNIIYIQNCQNFLLTQCGQSHLVN